MAIQLTEKDDLLQRQLDLELNQTKASKSRGLVNKLTMLLTGLLGGYFLFSTTPMVENFTGVSFISSLFAPIAPTVVEVFEIQKDLAIPVDAFVSNITVFNGSLTDGLKFKYHAPAEFNYTGAVLSLNFTNNGLTPEKPVVAEISVGKSPIWRTSTPYAKLNTIATSLTLKNVTEVLSLFEKNQSITLNYLEGDAASVDVELVLSLFNDTLTAPVAAVPTAPISVEALFSASGPADVVFPLTNAGKPFKLPTDKFSVALPQLQSNVTFAKIELFASASEDEIAYFKNDIGAIGAPATNGPLRYLNIFINDAYIGSISPKPTLFHSNEISNNDNATNLWQPLADTGAFEGLSYEIDLVSVLPLLWSAGAKLDIQVVSPVSSANKAPGVPAALPHPVLPNTNEITTGSWLLSGNLLAWESNVVNSAIGEVLFGESSQLDSAILIAPPAATPWQPSIKNQIVKTTIDTGVISQLNFTLFDNSTVNYTVEFNSSVHAFLTKQTKEIKKAAGPPGSGLGSTTKSTSITLITGIKFDYGVLDTATNLTLLTKNQTLDFPFTFSDSTIDSVTAIKGPSTTQSVKAEINSDIKTKVNGFKIDSYKVKEKVSLDEIIGATTDIKVQIQDVGELPFSREVEATNGVITKDTDVSSLAEDLKLDDLQEILDLSF